MRRRIFLALLGGAAASAGPADADRLQSIGIATMAPDGTITLRLRAQDPGGIRGDGVLVYKPNHPQYPEILRHLGGLHPGETKPVPAWPDPSSPPRL